MKSRMLLMTAVAGCYLLTSVAGFAQSKALSHRNDSESNAAAIEAHNTAFLPVPADTRNSTEKTLPLAPVPRAIRTPRKVSASRRIRIYC